MMKSEEGIKLLAIGNMYDRSLVADYVVQVKREKVSKLRSGVKDTMEKLILISISAHERNIDKFNDYLKIVSVVDQNVKWAFVAIIDKDYPEWIIFKMLTELENKTLKTLNTKFFNSKVEDNPSLKSEKDSLELMMVELYQKYKDPNKANVLYSLQTEVNGLQTQMKSNINQVIINIDNTKLLDDQSRRIVNIAKDFKDNSKQLEKATRWGNWKLNLAIGGVTSSAVAYFAWAFLK